MRTKVTWDMIDELLSDDEIGELEDFENFTPEEYREHSRVAELWATSEDFQVEDEPMRIGLLVAASQQALFAGDVDRAVAVAERAVSFAEALEDWLIPDARVNLYHCLREAGREADAAGLEQDLRARLPDGVESFDEMADVVATAGDLELAETWYRLGIRYAEENDLTDDFEFESLVLSRAEMRTEAGLPKDDYDILADAIEASMAEDF